jgi:uncharacterized protein YdeI (YjbR/CyaY-like superfamily)
LSHFLLPTTLGRLTENENNSGSGGHLEAPSMTATPEELQSALAKDPAAKSAFEALPPSHRKEYADWVAGAKKPETRLTRAEKAAAMVLSRTPPK